MASEEHPLEQQESWEKLRSEVRDARELLEFAVSRGRPVDNQIVEDIGKAEEFFHDINPPLPQERATFEKAYRDLACLLSPVTVDTLRTSFWHEGVGALVASLLVVLLLLTLRSFWSEGEWNFALGWDSTGIVGLRAIAVAAPLIWFLYLFTGVVNEKKLNQIVLFCYFFTILALLSPMLFLVVGFPRQLSQAMLTGPIGILRGCSDPAKQDNPKWIAEELSCDNKANQWMLNIGGVIEEPGAHADQKGAADILLIKEHPKQSVLTQDSQAQAFQVHVRGGLTVPLYIVLLSLMGGAVSMTRRVPEYQRRALDSKDPMTKEVAREYLVFQIMQVLSAPLIAVTAYHIFEPTTGAVSVTLGFISGFASETILLGIHTFVTKLQPVEPIARLPVSEKASSAGQRDSTTPMGVGAY